jgi:RNA polymerase sigma-70 factor (ECF subfamily)
MATRKAMADVEHLTQQPGAGNLPVLQKLANMPARRYRDSIRKMATNEISSGTIEALLRLAARCSVIRHEAEDLVQDVLLSAVEKNRDCGDPSFLPWATGAIRNRARFAARTAARRKRREHSYAAEPERSAHSLPRFPDAFLISLPRSRRVVALLVNLGMGRREITYLLGLSDLAMRQRIAGVRRAFAAFAGEAETGPHASFEADGLARRALKASLLESGQRRFAVRDPDGTPVFFSSHRSRFSRRRQQRG